MFSQTKIDKLLWKDHFSCKTENTTFFFCKKRLFTFLKFRFGSTEKNNKHQMQPVVLLLLKP